MCMITICVCLFTFVCRSCQDTGVKDFLWHSFMHLLCICSFNVIISTATPVVYM